MTVTEFTAEDYATKIRKMLDLAEGTDNETEAETFRERAYLLMEKYSIDEAMINDAAPIEKDELVTEKFTFTGRFQDANLLMSYYIATAFGMRGTKGKYDYPEKRSVLTLYGWKRDMEKFRVLNASLQIQAIRAMKDWEKRIDLRNSYLAQWDKFKARRAFITGFGSGVQSKLQTAHREAERAVARERAAESGGTVEEESTGVALVLRNRKETVDDWYDEQMGSGRRRRGRTFTTRGTGNAWNTGRSAGHAADTGQGQVGGTRRALR